MDGRTFRQLLAGVGLGLLALFLTGVVILLWATGHTPPVEAAVELVLVLVLPVAVFGWFRVYGGGDGEKAIWRAGGILAAATVIMALRVYMAAPWEEGPARELDRVDPRRELDREAERSGDPREVSGLAPKDSFPTGQT